MFFIFRLESHTLFNPCLPDILINILSNFKYSMPSFQYIPTSEFVSKELMYVQTFEGENPKYKPNVPESI